MNHLDSKYWLALGGVLQTQRKFAEAVKVYANIMIIDMHEAQAYYRLAECKLALGDRAEALEALEMLKNVADVKTATGREYVAKAEKMVKRLNG